METLCWRSELQTCTVQYVANCGKHIIQKYSSRKQERRSYTWIRTSLLAVGVVHQRAIGRRPHLEVGLEILEAVQDFVAFAPITVLEGSTVPTETSRQTMTRRTPSFGLQESSTRTAGRNLMQGQKEWGRAVGRRET